MIICPRCGKELNDTVNFCGACGLPRAEIDRLNALKVSETPVQRLDDVITQLEQTIADPDTVKNYTINTQTDTEIQPLVEKPEQQETAETADSIYENTAVESGSSDSIQYIPPQEYATENVVCTDIDNKRIASFDIPAENISQAEAEHTAYTATQPQSEKTFTPSYIQYTNSQNYAYQPKTRTTFDSKATSSQFTYRQQTAPVAQRDDTTTSDFILSLLIADIPVVGLLYLLYLAFNNTASPAKRAFAKAKLVMRVFVVLLVIVFAVAFLFTTSLYI